MPEPTTPPEILTVCQHPNGGDYVPHATDGSCFMDCDCDPAVYVPVSVVDALREENERLRELESGDWMARYIGVCRQADALRARVEELEAELRDAIEEVGCAPVAHMPHLAHQAQVSAASVDRWRALLSGGSQAPRPDTDEGAVGSSENLAIRPGGFFHRLLRPDTDETCPACEPMRDTSGRIRWTCPGCGGSGRRPDTKETK